MRWKSGKKNSENESPDGCLRHLQAFAWSFDWGEIKPQKQEIEREKEWNRTDFRDNIVPEKRTKRTNKLLKIDPFLLVNFSILVQSWLCQPFKSAKSEKVINLVSTLWNKLIAGAVCSSLWLVDREEATKWIAHIWRMCDCWRQTNDQLTLTRNRVFFNKSQGRL